VVVLLNCAQPADVLFAELAAADPPSQAADAASAKRRVGKVDLRTYGIGAQILKDLGVGRMRLLSAPRKMPSMTGYDLEVSGFEPGNQE
jgi:3,4-dihydroxy 2-butanone 4-phosphate synthase/GTP cyclohydrolase II